MKKAWPHSLRAYLVARIPFVWGASFLGLAIPMLSPLASSATLAWITDLAVHWQWQYTVMAMSLALVYAFLTRGRLAVFMLTVTTALVIANFTLLSLQALPEHPNDQSNQSDQKSQNVRNDPILSIASFNINLDNMVAPGFEAWVQANGPDILVILEATPEHAPLLARLKASYPHSVSQLQNDPFGMALLSRHPLIGAKVSQHQASTPYLEAGLNWAGKLIRVIAIHPMPPISSADKVARDALLVRVTQKDSEPTLIVGDFNASPWALGMRDLNRTGFKRASGMMPTQSLFGGLPIDHILASESHWRTAQAGVAGSFGSDHSVVWGKLTLAP